MMKIPALSIERAWIIFTVLVMIVCTGSCSDDPPVNTEQCVSLSIAYVSTTRIVIKVSAPTTGSIILSRDDVTVYEGLPSIPDHFVIDSTIVPGRSYIYRCLLNTGTAQCTSSIEVRSLDTTQHPSGSYTLDTLGGASSILSDIAVLDDNDIWATGFFWPDKMNSQNGLDSIRNMVHWDGVKWTYFTLPPGMPQSGVFIEKTGESELVVRTLGFHVYRNAKWTTLPVPPGPFSAYDVCVTSDRRYHFVGTNGFWSIWNGDLKSPTFQTFKLPEEIMFTDCATDGERVYAVGKTNTWSMSYLYMWEPSTSGTNTPIQILATQNYLTAIWRFAPSSAYAISGVFPAIVTPYETITLPQSEDYPVYKMVKGSTLSNIFFAGGYGGLVHYNGKSFRSYEEAVNMGVWYEICLTEDKVYLAGNIHPNSGLLARGCILRMRL